MRAFVLHRSPMPRARLRRSNSAREPSVCSSSWYDRIFRMRRGCDQSSPSVSSTPGRCRTRPPKATSRVWPRSSCSDLTTRSQRNDATLLRRHASGDIFCRGVGSLDRLTLPLSSRTPIHSLLIPRSMQYVKLGHTGLTVSRICLGCMSYGDPKWRHWVLDEASAQPFFKAALDHGINFFDTADMYSLGLSEGIAGRALRSMANLDEIVIATKVFYPMTDRPNMGGLSGKHIVQACEASLKRLGIDTIDLYQSHRLDPSTPIGGTLAALDHLVHHGKVRYIGASS